MLAALITILPAVRWPGFFAAQGEHNAQVYVSRPVGCLQGLWMR